MKKESAAPAFSGGEFIKAATGTSKDILTVLLDPAKHYTEAQISEMVSGYLHKEAKV